MDRKKGRQGWYRGEDHYQRISGEVPESTAWPIHDAGLRVVPVNSFQRHALRRTREATKTDRLLREVRVVVSADGHSTQGGGVSAVLKKYLRSLA